MFSAFVVSISFPLFLCACWIEVACETTCRCIKLLRESTHGKQTETDHKSCINMCEHVHPSDCAAFLSCPTRVNQVSQTCSRSENCHLLTHNRVQTSPPSADSMAQDNFGSLAEIARIADAEEALATMVRGRLDHTICVETALRRVEQAQPLQISAGHVEGNFGHVGGQAGTSTAPAWSARPATAETSHTG